MVDAAVIKKTQDSLGKVIKKPPLTDKLLSKPPFRYLHDIISEVVKSTGFLEGLYGDDEKTSANVKEKEQKLLFLQKAIDAVGLATGSPIAARPTKIIAGQEPVKTNEFLQLLGRCAAKGADSDIVQRVKKGEKPGKKAEPAKDGNKPRKPREKEGEKKSARPTKERDSSKGRGRGEESAKRGAKEQSSSKERVNSKERVSSKERVASKERPAPKERSKERVSGAKERPSKERPERSRRERPKEESTEVSQKVVEKKEPEKKAPEKKEPEKKEPEKKEPEKRKEEKKEDEKMKLKDEEEEDETEQPAAETAPDLQQEDGDDEEKALTNGFHEEDAPARIPRPSSAKGARRRPDPPAAEPAEEEKPTYAEAVSGTKPADAPLVPIVSGKRRERPTSARPAPPRIKKKEDGQGPEVNAREGSGRPPAGIIVDSSATQDDDDDDMFVSEEPEGTAPVKNTVSLNATEQHGGLVQKIIDSQKQYTGSEKQDDKAPIMNQAARQKERAIVKKEIDLLRSGIQTLASSAAPLGKVLDYLQEDLDSMQKELESWRSENKYHETAIKAEESHMEKTLEPLRDQLEDTEQQIIDMINKINSTKCNIHNNDQKIEQMLSTMSFSAS